MQKPVLIPAKTGINTGKIGLWWYYLCCEKDIGLLMIKKKVTEKPGNAEFLLQQLQLSNLRLIEEMDNYQIFCKQPIPSKKDDVGK